MVSCPIMDKDPKQTVYFVDSEESFEVVPGGAITLTMLETPSGQYPIDARYLDHYLEASSKRLPAFQNKRIEALPWGEIVGRKVTGVSFEKGRVVLTLSSKYESYP